ncbi:MAG: ArnT family glycosyltransferase, partial [Aggregatilineales bacterium]
MSQPERFVYLLIIVGYLVAGSLFALRTPPWQAPDEPAHYNYIAQAADGMLLPVIQEGDWDNDYLEALKSARFAPDMLGKLDTVRYENHQPPLYYWLSTPVFLLTGGSLIALRFFALFIGLFTVLLSYRVALAIFPNEQKIALAAMAFVAFLPQHLAILASVNNDSLALALVALMLLQTIRYLKHETVPVWQLGLLIGIAIVTKTTVYFMGAVILLAILLR